ETASRRREGSGVAELHVVRDRAAVAADLGRRREGDGPDDHRDPDVVTAVGPRQLAADVGVQGGGAARELDGEVGARSWRERDRAWADDRADPGEAGRGRGIRGRR